MNISQFFKLCEEIWSEYGSVTIELLIQSLHVDRDRANAWLYETKRDPSSITNHMDKWLALQAMYGIAPELFEDETSKSLPLQEIAETLAKYGISCHDPQGRLDPSLIACNAKAQIVRAKKAEPYWVAFNEVMKHLPSTPKNTDKALFCKQKCISAIEDVKRLSLFKTQMTTLAEYVFQDRADACDDEGYIDPEKVVQRAVELATKVQSENISQGDPSGSEFSFWLVWNPKGSKPPHYKHGDFGSAKQEAIRLATENKGRGLVFYVMQAVTKVTFEGLRVERLDKDEIPF